MQQNKYDRKVYARDTDMFVTFFWAVFGGFLIAGLFNALVFSKVEPAPFWVAFTIVETALQAILWLPYVSWERGRARYLAELPPVTPAEPEVPLPTYQPGLLRRVDGKIINQKR